MNSMDFDDDLLQQILKIPCDPLQVDGEPYLEILKQPRQRGYRFRYSSEGNTHGGITADSSGKGSKSYPTIQIGNFSGRASIYITLVTASDPVTVHAHNLVGKDVKNGTFFCDEVKEEWVKSFPNLGIQHVTKKDLVRVIEDKLCQQYQLNQLSSANEAEVTQSFDIAQLVDSFGAGVNDAALIDESVATAVEEEEKKRLRKEAEKLSKEIDLSAVRLCFQAFLLDDHGTVTKMLQPALSQPIYDQKAAHAGQLKICRMSKSSSSVKGGEEVFLLCDKVQKEDISVRFFQEDRSGDLKWEAFGKFGHTDVHKQCAIVFLTPPYIDRAIQKTVEVKVQLKRNKDGECSEPKPFTYEPEEYDKYKIGEKRRKGLPENMDDILQSAATAKQSKSSTATHALGAASNISFAEGSLHNPQGIKFFTPGSSKR